MQTSLTFATDNRLPEIHGRLNKLFSVSRGLRTDPLRQLLFAVVSEGSAPSVGLGIFNRLISSFPTYLALRDASPFALEQLFVGLPDSSAKALGIPALLRKIEELRGDFELDFLKRLSTDAARKWLENLPGVSPSAASSVLAFSSLERSTMAIDSDTARVIRRLGLCPSGAPLSAVPRHVAERSPAEWKSKAFIELSDGLRKISRQVCHQGQPECNKCPLKDLCPSAEQESATIIPFTRKIRSVDQSASAIENARSK